MKNNVYPCNPQFYYIIVGFKGVKFIQACFRDESGKDTQGHKKAQVSEVVQAQREKTQSDQGLCCSYDGTLHHGLSKMRS